MKKGLLILIALVLTFMMVGCGLEAQENQVLTIVVPRFEVKDNNYNYNTGDLLEELVRDFNEGSDHQVILEEVAFDSATEYLATDYSFIEEHSYDLLFSYRPFEEGYRAISDQYGNKVSDDNKGLFKGLQDDYYLPFAVSIPRVPLNNNVLSHYWDGNVASWDENSLIEILRLWSADFSGYLGSYELERFFELTFFDEQIHSEMMLDEDLLTKAETFMALVNSGIYEKLTTDKVKYMDILDESSDFWLAYHNKRYDANLINLNNEACTYSANLLNPIDYNDRNKYTSRFVPQTSRYSINTYGFYDIGKSDDYEQAKEAFFNYLLSDEVQKKIYTTYGDTRRFVSGVVTESAYQEIVKLDEELGISDDSRDLRDYHYEGLKSGYYDIKLVYNYSLYMLLKEKLFELSFTEDLSRDALKAEMQELLSRE